MPFKHEPQDILAYCSFMSFLFIRSVQNINAFPLLGSNVSWWADFSCCNFPHNPIIAATNKIPVKYSSTHALSAQTIFSMS